MDRRASEASKSRGKEWLRAPLLSSLTVLIVIACGGSTESNLFGSSGGAGDGGASDGSSAGDGSTTTDGGPRPRFEDLTTCSAPGTCELGAKGCCGLTCQPDNQLVAIRRGEAQALVQATCDESGPIACPGCARQLDPNIQAFCVSGECKVVDLRTDKLAECSGDDCVLQYASCCQPCSGGSVNEIVAVRKNNVEKLSEQLCSGTETCDKCLPAFPDGLRAVCNPSTKHCEVQKL